VAVARLGRAAVAAAVMGYDAMAVIEEKQHLRVPTFLPIYVRSQILIPALYLCQPLRLEFLRDQAHILRERNEYTRSSAHSA
jgi:hypothetical protein